MSSNSMLMQRQLDLNDFHRQWWLIDAFPEEDTVSKDNVDGHFRVFEHTLD
jgi:hypothetical protein